MSTVTILDRVRAHCLSLPEIAAAIEEAYLTVAPRKLVEAAGLGAP